jgi:multidrug efflux pump subunit AcrB
MTALTTILGLLTLALGFGEGSELLQPMAITAIGGLLYGTVLTLVVVPTIYAAINWKKIKEEERADS